MKSLLKISPIAVLLLTCVFFASCETDQETDVLKNPDNSFQTNRQIGPTAAGKLIIRNRTQFDYNFIITCYAYNNRTNILNRNLYLYAENERYMLPANQSVTYKNMNTESTPGINPGYYLHNWKLFDDSHFLRNYSAQQANNLYSEYYDVDQPQLGKFSHWKFIYLFRDEIQIAQSNIACDGQHMSIERGVSIKINTPESMNVSSNNTVDTKEAWTCRNTTYYHHIKAEGRIQNNGDTVISITDYFDTKK